MCMRVACKLMRVACKLVCVACKLVRVAFLMRVAFLKLEDSIYLHHIRLNLMKTLHYLPAN